MSRPTEEFGHLGRGGEPAGAPLPQPAQKLPCFLEGGLFCPEARAGIAGKLDLSPCQLEVAVCAMVGQSDKQIARTFRIKRATVRTHLRHVYGKLGVHNRAELSKPFLAAHDAWLRDSPPVPLPPSWCNHKRRY